ncbi:MAG: ribonuclease P [Candidatus Aenigmatarchaeota archaeon]|nr:MAG: ribonuclease P [Candidatus Aenigmarchaeota archaeon]
MRPFWQRRIAKERIILLLREAEKIFSRNRKLAKRYIELARRIGMKYRVRMPRKYKRMICRNCHTLLRPGANCKVEIDSKLKVVVYTCQECGHVKRYPYKGKIRKKKSKRRSG